MLPAAGKGFPRGVETGLPSFDGGPGILSMAKTFRRTQVTRIRQGSSDLIIDPAWIKPRRTGLPRSSSPTEIGIDAEVKVGRLDDVLEGDVLHETATATKLFVFQIQHGTNIKLCLCLEVTADTLERKRAGQGDLTLDVSWFYPASSGFERDSEAGSRMKIRVRRGADVVEGDQIENSALSKSWFIYEVLNEQLTKLCLGQEITGRQMTRVRGGMADQVIDPIWLLPRPSASTSVRFQGMEVPISAQVMMSISADVLVGDVLIDSVNNLILFVYQVLPALTLKTALCQEAPLFQDDEFTDGQIANSWFIMGGTWSETSTPGQISVTPPANPIVEPLKGAFLYQELYSGDFDVWTRLEMNSGPLGGPPYCFGYIGVRFPDGRGIYIGQRGDSSEQRWFRLDDDGAGNISAVDKGAAVGAFRYLRIKRVGATITVYTSGGSSEPTDESGWTEQSAPASPMISGAGQVKVGIGGLVVGTTPGSFDPLHYDWARRWSVGSAIFFNTLKNGIALTGAKDGVNKVFTIPDSIKLNSEIVYWKGQRQVRGDDYTIAGSTLTFTASHPAPAAGDTLVADYLV